jgi:hypothetical protein
LVHFETAVTPSIGTSTMKKLRVDGSRLAITEAVVALSCTLCSLLTPSRQRERNLATGDLSLWMTTFARRLRGFSRFTQQFARSRLQLGNDARSLIACEAFAACSNDRAA